MRRFFLVLMATGLMIFFFIFPIHARTPQCDAIVQAANQVLALQNKNIVRDESKLAALLRTLNRDGRLPAEYVTREQAMEQGWSGKAEDSLWRVWVLNKKQLGGDLWIGKKFADVGDWYSADIDSVRGLSTDKYLIYNPESAVRYLTTDNGATAVVLLPCQ